MFYPIDNYILQEYLKVFQNWSTGDRKIWVQSDREFVDNFDFYMKYLFKLLRGYRGNKKLLKILNKNYPLANYIPQKYL